ncbi:addiction module toxin, RelE/StbE family [Thioalkalivibrio nitratireducens DSM 14787]|uniref:Addiction module toxin, RelE/StbE family n=1 Tax=Thioalkalivibrio nitratireducens (strain DSM 14787 / UNIQEM 213 / ALEN2) TaxID=1255043 RepID=L0DZD4_THIND|nr:type II toxin-antitoxin system RelE/ParE family toxin [Thioalkalivibrio nitratireducens]AGA34944.1 addiction module toxin, RelE/StbE family [Thioalkalivibrio nitratireducens DSM 14787]
MAWNVEFIDTARRQLARLDRKWQAAILDYLEDEIAPLDDPRSRGKPLVGDRKGLWRYRVGDYRILCELQDNHLIVLVVTIGHRREVYRKR